MTTSDGTSITYKYNADGIRTKKKVESVEHEYYYSNGHLVYEKYGDVELYFSYDGEGNLERIQRVTSSGTSYFYTA